MGLKARTSSESFWQRAVPAVNQSSMALLGGRLPVACRGVFGRVAPRLAPRCFARAFSDIKFAKTHEWLKVEGDVATLGISSFAQDALGEIVYCDLPSEGDTFEGKTTICTLESVKAVGEVYAPADCEVIAVNESLSDEPALVNSSPMEDGWLIKVKLTGAADGLLDQTAYDAHVEAESKDE